MCVYVCVCIDYVHWKRTPKAEGYNTLSFICYKTIILARRLSSISVFPSMSSSSVSIPFLDLSTLEASASPLQSKSIDNLNNGSSNINPILSFHSMYIPLTTCISVLFFHRNLNQSCQMNQMALMSPPSPPHTLPSYSYTFNLSLSTINLFGHYLLNKSLFIVSLPPESILSGIVCSSLLAS